MARYGLVFDIEKCCGCYACFLSCRDEFSGKDHFPTAASQEEGQRWLNIEEIEYGEGSKIKVDYFAKMCQQCEDPLCAKGAPEGAVYRRDDGIVVFDPEKTKGEKGVVDNCPYGVVFWNEARQLPQKCTMCAHMLDSGEKNVRCSECCPTGAMVFGDLDDPASAASLALKAKSDRAEAWIPEEGAKPSCRYIAIPKPFLAGEVYYEDNAGEPAKGVALYLTDKSGGKLNSVTDCFGDFEFTRLEKGQTYTLRIEADGYQEVTRVIDLGDSINLGAIALSPHIPA